MFTQLESAYISLTLAAVLTGIYIYLCLIVCLFVYLFVCLSVCLFICLFVYLFVCLSVCLFDVDPSDFLPPPPSPLTFWEGNVGSPLCKEITIVDDCDAEMLEEFEVQARPLRIVGVEVQFAPARIATVKITDDDTPGGNAHKIPFCEIFRL